MHTSTGHLSSHNCRLPHVLVVCSSDGRPCCISKFQRSHNDRVEMIACISSHCTRLSLMPSTEGFREGGGLLDMFWLLAALGATERELYYRSCDLENHSALLVSAGVLVTYCLDEDSLGCWMSVEPLVKYLGKVITDWVQMHSYLSEWPADVNVQRSHVLALEHHFNAIEDENSTHTEAFELKKGDINSRPQSLYEGLTKNINSWPSWQSRFIPKLKGRKIKVLWPLPVLHRLGKFKL